jgi:S1-C subfamily serine protease
MTFPLSALSDAISRLIGLGAPLLTAIRIGPNRHITGLLGPGGAIVTTDQALPASDAYTVVLSDRSLVPAQPGFRDTPSNLATLLLETEIAVSLPGIAAASLGDAVVVLGADADASPTVRLTVVHRFLRTADGLAAVLDLAAGALDPGSPVLNAEGHLLGQATPGPNGELIVIPGAAIARILHEGGGTALRPGHAPTTPLGRPHSRRGWLGMALQPIIVPDQLVPRAGQSSGRMVVNITTGGPADRAGMRVGDVLLSLNGGALKGQHGLRTFLAEEPIGSAVEVKLLRDGNLMTAHLVVAAQP